MNAPKRGATSPSAAAGSAWAAGDAFKRDQGHLGLLLLLLLLIPRLRDRRYLGLRLVLRLHVPARSHLGLGLMLHGWESATRHQGLGLRIFARRKMHGKSSSGEPYTLSLMARRRWAPKRRAAGGHGQPRFCSPGRKERKRRQPAKP